jgi:hypothetical protein
MASVCQGRAGMARLATKSGRKRKTNRKQG